MGCVVCKKCFCGGRKCNCGMSSKQHREFALANRKIGIQDRSAAIDLAKKGLKTHDILKELGVSVEKEKVPVSPQKIKGAREKKINFNRACQYQDKGSYARCIYCNSVKFYMKNKDCLNYKKIN